jgi:Ca2+-binding EF-hand superfamily protein
VLKLNSNPYCLEFHLESPEIYKLIEDLCLTFDREGELLNFKTFIDYINEKLANHNTRQGLQSIFEKVMDKKLKEITPETFHALCSEVGDELSLDDVYYLLEKIADPSHDINITSDEFYYIMTKKPAEVELITPVTKNLK